MLGPIYFRVSLKSRDSHSCPGVDPEVGLKRTDATRQEKAAAKTRRGLKPATRGWSFLDSIYNFGS